MLLFIAKGFQRKNTLKGDKRFEANEFLKMFLLFQKGFVKAKKKFSQLAICSFQVSVSITRA